MSQELVRKTEQPRMSPEEILRQVQSSELLAAQMTGVNYPVALYILMETTYHQLKAEPGMAFTSVQPQEYPDGIEKFIDEAMDTLTMVYQPHFAPLCEEARRVLVDKYHLRVIGEARGVQFFGM